MTLKTRNRLNFSLFIVSLVILLGNMLFFLLTMINDPIQLDLSSGSVVKSLLFGYQPLAVIGGLFLLNLYVVGVSKAMTNAFAKTQCPEISFFFCFLIALLAECSRFYIPMLSVQNTFSERLIFIGNFSIFARILAPLSLLSAAILSGSSQRQHIERNMLLIIVVSMVIAMILPLNTGFIERDFRVHAGFDNIIVTFEVLVDVLAFFSLIILNLMEGNSQKTAVGMAFIIAGYVLAINSLFFPVCAVSFVFLIWGTVLYLKNLHDRNLFS